jgi:hypothetical protein
MVNWKQLLVPGVITGIGLAVLYGQYRYQWISFANMWSGIIFVELCLALIAVGQGMMKIDIGSRIKYGILSFVLNNVALLIIGGIATMNDAVNGTTLTSSAGAYVAFDTLSTPFTSKALEFKIVVDTIVGAVPSMMLIVSVISIWTAGGPDELQSAVFEIIIVLAVLTGFAFLGNLFGFAFV